MAYYGNAPADVALVVGSDVITTTEIQDATIATADIANDAITAVKIDDDGTGFQMGSLGLGTAVSGSEKLTVGGTASFTGDITGTLATASQPNITSVGTLTSLTTSGEALASYSGARFRATDGTSSLVMGLWDGVNNRIESANRSLLLTTYSGTINLGLSGGTTMAVGSGVTLNGSLTGTSATFSGAVGVNGASVGSNKFAVDNGTSSLNRGNSSGDILDVRGLNASQMKVTTSAFTVTPNATFAGNVGIANNKYITFGDYCKIGEDIDNQDALTIEGHSTESMYFTNSDNATTRLELTGAGNATFAGSVTTGGMTVGGTSNLNGDIRLSEGVIRSNKGVALSASSSWTSVQNLDGGYQSGLLVFHVWSSGNSASTKCQVFAYNADYYNRTVSSISTVSGHSFPTSIDVQIVRPDGSTTSDGGGTYTVQAKPSDNSTALNCDLLVLSAVN